MKCIKFSIKENYFNSRCFIYYEKPSENNPEGGGGVDDALEALQNRIKWRSDPGAAEKWKERVKAGKESYNMPEQREKRDFSGPINPTDQTLEGLAGDDGTLDEHGIRPKLQHIFDDIFPRRYASKFSNKTSDKYVRILRDIPEAIMIQAITENGSEEELLRRFKTELSKVRDKIESSAVPDEAWNCIKGFFRWLIDDKEWDLEGENPHVQNSTIKPRHKTAIGNEMKKLEDYYRKRLHDKYGRWWIIPDKYKNEDVKFLEKIELPFYREFFMNQAILENTDTVSLAEKYSEFLKRVFRECIKDDTEKQLQLVEDNRDESQERIGKADWFNAVLAMRNHVQF